MTRAIFSLRRARIRRRLAVGVVTALALGIAANVSGAEIQGSYGRIAYADETGIYVVRSTDAVPRRVARASWACCIAWSANSRQLAYSSYGQGLFAVAADGSARRRLTKHDESDTPGAWSPDGRSITFDRNYDGDHSIWVVAATGGAARRLTSDGYYAPDWSPNGDLIAYGGARFSRQGIWVINLDDGRRRRLTGSSLDGAPRWSHDGSRLAFLRGGAVWIMNADGSGQRRVVSSRGSEETGELRWSPDDRMLAFTRKLDDRDVFVVTAAATHLRNLTANSSLRDSCPSWSPDGRSIAFASDRSGRNEIYVTNLDGDGVRRVGRIATGDTCPVWSPGG